MPLKSYIKASNNRYNKIFKFWGLFATNRYFFLVHNVISCEARSPGIGATRKKDT